MALVLVDARRDQFEKSRSANSASQRERDAPPRAVRANGTGRKEVRLLVFGRTRATAGEISRDICLHAPRGRRGSKRPRARDRASGAPLAAGTMHCISRRRERERERGRIREEKKGRHRQHLVFSFSCLVARLSCMRLDCPSLLRIPSLRAARALTN